MTANRPYTGVTNRLDIQEREGKPDHICGRCRTPTGKSAIECPNEFPEVYERARRVAAYKAATEGQQQ